MRSHVDIINHFEVRGWSLVDPPLASDRVIVYVDRREVAQIPATGYRADLKAKSIGTGYSAFSFNFPDAVGIFHPVEIEVRSLSTGEALANGKKVLPALLDGGGMFRHSFRIPSHALNLARLDRNGDTYSVTARALAPRNFNPSIICEADGQPVEPLAIVDNLNEDLPEEAPRFRTIRWSFRPSTHDRIGAFSLVDRNRPEAGPPSPACTICLPLDTTWFTNPSEENYVRTAGNVYGPEALIFTGLTHAYAINAIAQRLLGKQDLTVADWGVGFGRIAMPFKRVINAAATIIGFDVDRLNLAWCLQNLPDIEVRQCGLYPPLPIDDASLDLVYGYSVMTHLTEAAQEVWLRELRRVIKPGGICILTTTGEHLLKITNVRTAEVLKQLAWSGLSDIRNDNGPLGSSLDKKGYYRGTLQLRQQVETAWAHHFEIVNYLPFAFPQDAVVMRRP